MIPAAARQQGEVIIHYPFRPNGEQIEYDITPHQPQKPNPKPYFGFVTQSPTFFAPAGYGQYSVAVYEPSREYRWLSFNTAKARTKWLQATAAKNDRLLRAAKAPSSVVTEKVADVAG